MYLIREGRTGVSKTFSLISINPCGVTFLCLKPSYFVFTSLRISAGLRSNFVVELKSKAS